MESSPGSVSFPATTVKHIERPDESGLSQAWWSQALGIFDMFCGKTTKQNHTHNDSHM